MKRGKKIFKPFFLFSAGVLFFIFPSSCKKNKDAIANITVVDFSTNAPVVGATVHMYPPPSAGGNLQVQDQTGITDAAGSVSFTFKFPAILQTDVIPPAPYTGTSVLVKLEEGKTIDKTIKVL